MACMAQFLKVSIDALKRDSGAQVSAKREVRGARSSVQGPPAQDVSKDRYVTRRMTCGSTYWVGQPGQRKQKLCRSQEEVAAWVAKQRKTSPDSLLKGKALYTYGAQYQQKLQVVLRIRAGGSKVPDDVEHLRRHATFSEKVFVQEPALEILGVQAKYGPSLP